MRYTSFTIKNYKGIKEMTLDLDESMKVTTLVGLNESGKTTVLEALKMIEDVPDAESAHDLIPKNQKFDFNGCIEVSAILALDSQDEKKIAAYLKAQGITAVKKIGKMTVAVRLEFENSEIVDDEHELDYELDINIKRKGYKKYRRLSYADPVYVSLFNYIEATMRPSIIYYPDFLFDFPERIYLEADAEMDYFDYNYYTVISDIVSSIDGNIQIHQHLTSRIKSTNPKMRGVLESMLEKMSEKVNRTILHEWKQLFGSSGMEVRLNVGLDEEAADAVEPDENEKPGLPYIEVRLKEGTEHYEIRERSLGFRWFFAFVLFTEFRKLRDPGKGETLFLLDEPASNLHSTAQRKLLETFRNLVSHSRLIYTTHSHHLINPDWLQGAYVINNTGANYDRIETSLAKETLIEAVRYNRFVGQHPNKTSHFQPILDALEYQPSSLEQIPDIVICEGKTDYYTFRYLAEVILGNEYKDLKFYPGSGSGSNRQVIRLYLAWGRNFTILLDGDKEGERAKEIYQRELGPAVDAYLLTLKDIDKTFSFALEKLFTPEDRLQITRIIDPKATSFSKDSFHQAIMTLHHQRKAIELSEQTLIHFKKVLDRLLSR